MKHLYLKYKPHYQTNLKLALPVIIAQLGQVFVQVIHAICVGQFAGTMALAALAVTSGVFFIMLVIGTGISHGLTPLIAQENGKKQYEECAKLLSNSLLINLVTGILLCGLTCLFVLLVIDHLGQSPEVVRLAKPCLFLLGFSFIPFMIFMAFRQFGEGLGFTKSYMIIMLGGHVANVVIGVILVRGFLGIPSMGVAGIGLAILIDYILMMIVGTLFVFKSKHFHSHLKLFALTSIDRIRSIKILKIGAPVAMQYTFEVSAFTIAGLFIGTLGAAQQAAHHITMNLVGMAYMMASGVAAAATINTGNNYGKSHFKKMHSSASSNYHIILLLMTMTTLIFIILNEYIPLAYTTDQSVIMIAAQLLIVAGFLQLVDGAQVVGLGVLRGMGDVSIPTYITFLSYWVIGIPSSYYFGIILGLGAIGIWYGLTFGLLCSAVLLFFRFHYFSQKLISQQIGL